ncbi:MAG TPA: hypothetical protein VGH76_17595 [Actinomycetospora sp.]|uniref:hypothetical protein n=1 Tax=Actinomycetospora sp. TaxID=1872135 RepID=UPI002F4258FB
MAEASAMSAMIFRPVQSPVARESATACSPSSSFTPGVNTTPAGSRWRRLRSISESSPPSGEPW